MGDLWMTKRLLKTCILTFFHMNFLHSFSYLTHCKHFVDVFSPISAAVTSRNTIFFILMIITKL